MCSESALKNRTIHERVWPSMAKKTVDINVGKSKFSRNQKAGGSTSVQLDCASGKLPFDIAIELPDGRAHAVVRRGRTLPIHQEELFSTASSYQTAMEFHVVYGNRPLAKDCESIARIRLRNIRWSAAGFRKSRSISTWIKQACSPLASTISIEKTKPSLRRTRFPRVQRDRARCRRRKRRIRCRGTRTYSRARRSPRIAETPR